jgi:hypothetical protein
MAVMFGNLYRALTVAGAPDEQAQKAAEEVASYEKAINEVRSDTAVLKWMVGFNTWRSASRPGQNPHPQLTARPRCAVTPSVMEAVPVDGYARAHHAG